jgi:hypothetical protein
VEVLMAESDLTEIKISLAKLVVMNENLAKVLEEHIKKDEKVADRVTALETRNTYVNGILVAAVFAWGILSDKILHLIGLK